MSNSEYTNSSLSASQFWYWWLRSPYTGDTGIVCFVGGNGGYYFSNASISRGIRPAVILPSNALFDETTMLLKGVA